MASSNLQDHPFDVVVSPRTGFLPRMKHVPGDGEIVTGIHVLSSIALLKSNPPSGESPKTPLYYHSDSVYYHSPSV